MWQQEIPWGTVEEFGMVASPEPKRDKPLSAVTHLLWRELFINKWYIPLNKNSRIVEDSTSEQIILW